MKASELGKQWGVAMYEYDAREIDLSRCDDQVSFARKITYSDIKANVETDFDVLKRLIANGGDIDAEDEIVEIYDAIGDGEEYKIYIPSWWD